MLASKSIASLAALLAASPVLAGSLDPVVVPAAPVMAPVPVITPAPASQGSDWTGFYVGGQLGFGDLTAHRLLPRVLVTPGLLPLSDDEDDGALYGLHAGYQHDFGRFVLGAEIDWNATELEIEPDDFGPPIEVDSIARAKLRLGYDAGRMLPYATAGYARAELSSDDSFIEDSYEGYFLGLGADYAVSDRVFLGAEVLRHNFDDTPHEGADVDLTTISLRASFRF